MKRVFDLHVFSPLVVMFIMLLLSHQAAAETFTVNLNTDAGDALSADNVCDSDLLTFGNQCTLRAAIEQANSVQSSDTVNFAANVNGTIVLAFGQLTVTDDLAINGPGAKNLRVSGDFDNRVFQINPLLGLFSDPIVVSITGLTIADGDTLLDGGGILNTGGATLNLIESRVTNNEAVTFGGGIATIGGDLTPTRTNITRSLIDNNYALGGGGGISNTGTTLGILLNATTTVTNSTVTSNSVGGLDVVGGGVLNTAGTFNVTNVTISHNVSTGAGGGAVNVVGVGPVGEFYLRNTIIAFNNAVIVGGLLSTSNDVLGLFDSLGNNLIGNRLNAEASFEASAFVGTVPQPNANADLVGSVSLETLVIDPKLEALTDNGGQTRSRSVALDSPAIDAGNNCVYTNTCMNNPGGSNPPTAIVNDQRGAAFTRRFDGNSDSVPIVDIGAFERQAATSATVKISGRVTDSQGRNLPNAVLTLRAQNGATKTVRTGKRGDYEIAGVTVSEIYILQIDHKLFPLTQQVLIVNSNHDNLDFVVGAPTK